jgi:hypothetical protein
MITFPSFARKRPLSQRVVDASIAGARNPGLRGVAAVGAAGVAAYLAYRYLRSLGRPTSAAARPLDTWEGEGGNLTPRHTRAQLDRMQQDAVSP